MTLARESSASTGADLSSLAQEWELTGMHRYRASAAGVPVMTAREGSWMLATVGGVTIRHGTERFVLEEGDAALIAAPAASSVTADAGAEIAIGDLRSLVPLVGIPNPLIVRGFAERFSALKLLVETCPLGDGCAGPLWSRAYANMLGAAMLTAWLESAPEATQDTAVVTVLAALTRAPGERWTLERMACVAHLSRSALAIRFRSTLGRSPSDVLRELRMNEARELLAQPRHPIGAVAHAVGYGSTAAFSRAFSSHHGIAPQAWREGRRGLSSTRVAD